MAGRRGGGCLTVPDRGMSSSVVAVARELRGRAADERIEAMIQLRSGDWVALYLDPATGELWKLFYPDGHLQGGGLPYLTPIPMEDAVGEFAVDPDEIARELRKAKRTRASGDLLDWD
ncbi:MAG: Imm27 family immunity protein [Actinomycetota bacterium]